MDEKVDHTSFPGGKEPASQLQYGVEQAREAIGSAVEQAQGAAEHVATAATELGEDVKERVVSAAEEGKAGFASQLDDAAAAVHRVGEEFEGDQDWLAQMAERGAAELGKLADTVRSNDLRGLVGRLEDLARRQPLLFMGAAMAAGFASARLGRVVIAGASRDDLPSVSRPHHQDTQRDSGAAA